MKYIAGEILAADLESRPARGARIEIQRYRLGAAVCWHVAPRKGRED